jgi:hypothetical protein
MPIYYHGHAKDLSYRIRPDDLVRGTIRYDATRREKDQTVKIE